MNRPERVSEPSMEEILASIRKIIAEEPGNGGRNGRSVEAAVAPLPANPLLKPSSTNAGRDELPLPSFGRLADALRGPAPNGSPTAAPKPMSSSYATSVLDDDLADLLQEPFPVNAAPAAAAPAPAPVKAETAPAAKTPAQAAAAPAPAADDSWAVWRSGTSKPASAPLGAPKAEAPSPAPAAAKPGFFPPAAAPAAQTAPAARVEPVFPALSGLTPAAPKINGSGLAAAPEAKPASSGPVVIAAMPMTPAAAMPAPAPVVVETRVIETVKKPATEEQATVPLPPRQIAIGASVPVSAFAAAPVVTPELAKSEADTSAAGASALGALAAGLAVASAQAAAAPAEPIAPAPVVTKTEAPATPAAPAVAAAPPAAAAPAAQAEPVRTLEDAVAEMLRPMLQQWLTDHMPRIIEKALRVETAKTVKDGAK